MWSWKCWKAYFQLIFNPKGKRIMKKENTTKQKPSSIGFHNLGEGNMLKISKAFIFSRWRWYNLLGLILMPCNKLDKWHHWTPPSIFFLFWLYWVIINIYYCISLRYTVWWLDTIHCEMIATVRLFSTIFSSCDYHFFIVVTVRTFKI